MSEQQTQKNAQKKKKPGNAAAQPAPAKLPDQLRTGMPAQDSIVNVEDFQSPTTGYKGKIIHTTEKDAYDQLPPAEDKNRQKK